MQFDAPLGEAARNAEALLDTIAHAVAGSDRGATAGDAATPKASATGEAYWNRISTRLEFFAGSPNYAVLNMMLTALSAGAAAETDVFKYPMPDVIHFRIMLPSTNSCLFICDDRMQFR